MLHAYQRTQRAAPESRKAIQPRRYRVIGENNPNEVAVYTDSNKIMVRALDEIYDKSAKREYWDGENVGVNCVTDCRSR